MRLGVRCVPLSLSVICTPSSVAEQMACWPVDWVYIPCLMTSQCYDWRFHKVLTSDVYELQISSQIRLVLGPACWGDRWSVYLLHLFTAWPCGALGLCCGKWPFDLCLSHSATASTVNCQWNAKFVVRRSSMSRSIWLLKLKCNGLFCVNMAVVFPAPNSCVPP